MQASADNLAFAPPPEPAAIRAFVLAVIAHLLLLLALTWGIHWQKETTVAAEAELWSRMPEQAAPPPAPVIPQPQPAPPPVVEKPAPPPVVKEADIVQEREKKRLEEEARRLREEEERKVLEAKKKQEQEEAAKRDRLAKEKAAAEERKKQLAKAEKDKQALEEKKLAQMREENMQRIQGLAGSSGGPNATGSALRSKGPSASYAGRIAGRIKPNIVFTDVVAGNPAAEVELRIAPDGTIVGSKLLKSSGVKSWDEAVLRAIEKTGSIPRDTDGSVVPEFPITFRPKD